MYADDTVIMAENEHDMQRNLNLLNDFCAKHNAKAGWVVIFNKDV